MTSTTARVSPKPAVSVPTPARALPWWRHGHVWLLIGGPVVVVVASMATAVLAFRSPDPLVTQDPDRRSIKVHPPLQPGADARALMPAVQGRNHAATPATP